MKLPAAPASRPFIESSAIAYIRTFASLADIAGDVAAGAGFCAGDGTQPNSRTSGNAIASLRVEQEIIEDMWVGEFIMSPLQSKRRSRIGLLDRRDSQP